MKPLYRRLGLKKGDMPARIWVEELEELPDVMRRRPQDTGLYKSEFASTTGLLALYYFYLEEADAAWKYARLMVDYAIEYFFGKWRAEVPIDAGPASPERRKRYGSWASQFRKAVFWASCLGQWKKVRRLAQYPTRECPIGRYEPKLVCIWLLLLAGVLRGELLESLCKYTDAIDRSRRKYYTLLLNVLRVVLDSDSENFNTLLREYLDYCNEKTFCRPEIDEKVSIDGTFLINFARHKGLKVEVPREYVDRIVVLGTA